MKIKLLIVLFSIILISAKAQKENLVIKFYIDSATTSHSDDEQAMLDVYKGKLLVIDLSGNRIDIYLDKKIDFTIVKMNDKEPDGTGNLYKLKLVDGDNVECLGELVAYPNNDYMNMLKVLYPNTTYIFYLNKYNE